MTRTIIFPVNLSQRTREILDLQALALCATGEGANGASNPRDA